MSLLQAVSPGSRRSTLTACEVVNPPCPEFGVRWVRFQRPPGIPESRWLCDAHARHVESALGLPTSAPPAPVTSPVKRVPVVAEAPARVDDPARCRFPGCADASPPTVRGLHKRCYKLAAKRGLLAKVALPSSKPVGGRRGEVKRA